ncbi:MAG: sulfatase-like hydrolase/transferase [Acidobacteriota bacterium]|nr:sulfatase-like hydrolase/transferase [Acidobacteriota bacterium]
MAYSPKRPAPQRLPSPRLDLFRFSIHLFTVYSLAVAQPLFSVLAQHPEFFVVRGLHGTKLLLLAIVLMVLPPLPSILLRIAAQELPRRPQRWVEGLLLAIPLVALLLFAFGDETRAALPGPILPALAALLAGGLAYLYLEFEEVRSFLSFLSISLLVLPAYFLIGNPALRAPAAADSEWVKAGAEAEPIEDHPVIVILFDELSLQSLLDADQRIDAQRFPGFAALAEISSWYRNTTAVAARTEVAVPALLSGRYPDPDALPTPEGYPQTLLSFLEGSHRRVVSEIFTSLCPVGCEDPTRVYRDDGWGILLEDLGIVYLHLILPQPYAQSLPPIDQDWLRFGGGAGRSVGDHPTQFRAFLDTLGPQSSRTFYFNHSHLPHRPYEFTASGLDYQRVTPVLQLRRQDYGGRMEYVYRRYLVQLLLVDRLITEMLEHLRRTGVLDQALLVVTADHGLRYLEMDEITGEERLSLAEWVLVPLFVKRPGQQEGEVVDRPASSLDVVPTVLEELGVLDSVRQAGRWKLQGIPLSQLPETRNRKALDDDRWIELPDSLDDELETVLTWKLATFGSGAEPHALHRKAAPRAHLIGRPLSSALAVTDKATGEDRVILDGADGDQRTLFFDPASGTIPLLVRGAVFTPKDDAASRTLAVAVDGFIEATVRSYVYEAGHQRFSVLLPESALPSGEHRLEVVVLGAETEGIDEAG